MDAAYSRKRILYPSLSGGANEYDLIIVDEASMVDSAMFSSVIRYLEKNNKTKVLFVGDKYQLPPPGVKEFTRIFKEVKDQFNLTEIVRQAQDNPILRLTEEIRDAAFNKREIKFEDFCTHHRGRGVLMGGSEYFMTQLKRCFAKEEYRLDDKKYRIIAFRNDRVAELNAEARSVIYPGVLDTYILGERVIAITPWWTARDPVDGVREIIVQTDQEGTLLSADDSFHPDFSSVPCKRLRIAMDQQFDVTAEVFAVVLNQEGVCPEFDALRLPILEDCEVLLGIDKTGRQVELRNPAWGPYHEIIKPFANVRCNDAARNLRYDNIRPAHAMTAHKSQGSTYRSVFVDARDILGTCCSLGDLQLGYRALYVAVSRAEFGVCILDPRRPD